MIIPASQEDVNLCKALISTTVLGYPSPVIVNWNQTFDTAGLSHGGSHLAKISGVYQYVSSLPASHDEDLVIMIDGYDVWLQFSPQTLLQRYFDIIRRANEKLKVEFDHRAIHERGMRNEIVFGCQKRCWPWRSKDPPCYAVPNSTLPDDIYGARTDLPSNNTENPYINYRPRFLVSGTAIGPVRAFRKLFKEAERLMKIEPNSGSDQYIFSHIFGDQQIWRESVLREELKLVTDGAILAEKLTHIHQDFKKEHFDRVSAKVAGRPDRNYEFGLTIDYESEIVLNTVFQEDDTEWLTFSNREAVLDAWHKMDVPVQHRSGTLRPDITNSLPPFYKLPQNGPPRLTEWQDVSLFTNVYTGNPPAVIHHNAHRNGMKSLRETWWPRVWFQQDARALLGATIDAPISSVAVVGYNESQRVQWWPYEEWEGGKKKGLAKVDSEPDGWVQFDDICRDYHEELFRDGKGPWQPWKNR